MTLLINGLEFPEVPTHPIIVFSKKDYIVSYIANTINETIEYVLNPKNRKFLYSKIDKLLIIYYSRNPKEAIKLEKIRKDFLTLSLSNKLYK